MDCMMPEVVNKGKQEGSVGEGYSVPGTALSLVMGQLIRHTFEGKQ